MDHQDWPGWPDDNSHLDDPHHDSTPLDNADTADLGGDHEPFDHAPFDHEPLGQDGLDTADPGADPGYDDESGHGHLQPASYPDDDPFTAEVAEAVDLDVVDDVEAATEPPVGADPDADPYGDGSWHDATFPPALDLLDAPEPVDGYPWGDAGLLGDGGPADGDEPAWQQPPSADLYEYAGEEPVTGGDAWQALLGSDDPATSTLARWWTPG